MRLISDEALAAITIWQEARGESYKGKVMVAEVIRNRAKWRSSSDGTIAGTVARNLQFSGWNANDPNRIPSLKLDDSDPVVQECVKAWREAVTTNTNFAKGALNYYASWIATPGWAGGMTEVAREGQHIFLVPH